MLTLGVLDGFLGGITPFRVCLNVDEAVQVRKEAQSEANGQQLGGKLFYRGIGLLSKHPVGNGNDLVDQTLVDELSIGVDFGDFSKNNGLGRVSDVVFFCVSPSGYADIPDSMCNPQTDRICARLSKRVIVCYRRRCVYFLVLLTMGIESVTVDCGQATKLIKEGSHRDWRVFVVQLRCFGYRRGVAG